MVTNIILWTRVTPLTSRHQFFNKGGTKPQHMNTSASILNNLLETPASAPLSTIDPAVIEQRRLNVLNDIRLLASNAKHVSLYSPETLAKYASVEEARAILLKRPVVYLKTTLLNKLEENLSEDELHTFAMKLVRFYPDLLNSKDKRIQFFLAKHTRDAEQRERHAQTEHYAFIGEVRNVPTCVNNEGTILYKKGLFIERLRKIDPRDYETLDLLMMLKMRARQKDMQVYCVAVNKGVLTEFDNAAGEDLPDEVLDAIRKSCRAVA